ncbi:hypothetical protein AVEN_271507-1 [Araneus ventricosus]|uniref:DNA helicase Pif1-like 2B domain-containing protein n=1 Tax=Araneus ventricosus TaxID=182803 RepID=A0A4Y2ID32_ARAVE|nr:hypothetical protein AVEN_271507-1 [Araneus ventricosus]
MFCLIFTVRYYIISICRYGNGHSQGSSYSVELFNILELSGAHSDKPRLDVCVPVLLIRNLDIPRLRNGTRLQITHLGPNVVKATVMTDMGRRESVLIPRLPIIPKDLSSEFKR